MRFSLTLLTTFAFSLSACAVAVGVSASSERSIPASCISLEKRAAYGNRPFTSLLAQECRSAAVQSMDGENPIPAWYANLYIQRVNDLEEAIRTLGRTPTRSGEYLIAREVGALTALDRWIAASNFPEPN